MRLFRLVIQTNHAPPAAGRGARASRAGLPSPIETKALAMPSDDRRWLHDQQGGFPVRRPGVTKPKGSDR
jgi:hypothetical protein